MKKTLLLSLSLLLVCTLAVFAGNDARPDAREDLLFNALSALHTEGHDPSEYTAYDWDGQIISDFYSITAPMDPAALQAYCRKHIQRLTRLQITEEDTLRGEPMKTGRLTCTEAYRTPIDSRYMTLQFTIEASAIYDESGTAFAYTYEPKTGLTQYALPDGWSCTSGGMGGKESIRKTDGHAYFQYQHNYTATYLGIGFDLGQSNCTFTIAP